MIFVFVYFQNAVVPVVYILIYRYENLSKFILQIVENLKFSTTDHIEISMHTGTGRLDLNTTVLFNTLYHHHQESGVGSACDARLSKFHF